MAPTFPVKRDPATLAPDHAEGCRNLSAVGAANRIAIHGGSRKGRLVAQSADIFGEGAAGAGGEGAASIPSGVATFASTRQRASSTDIRLMAPHNLPSGRRSCGETDVLDPHALIGGLHHVVDCQARDGHGGQRLHLDAGLARHLHLRRHANAGKAFVEGAIDLHPGDQERVAKRYQLVRALRRHDPGKARGAEHVALLGVALPDQAQSSPAASPRILRRWPCGW